LVIGRAVTLCDAQAPAEVSSLTSNVGIQAMLRSRLCPAFLILAGLGVEPAAAQQQSQTNVGRLVCRIGPGIGAVIGSRRQLTCALRATDGHVERYAGSVTRFGLDIGATAGGVMTWVVLTRTRGVRRGALAGHYVGLSGDASVGLGAGAKALIGGTRRAMVLQPVSSVNQVGINLAVGVAGLSLRFLGSSPPGQAAGDEDQP
jgi:hypothetical protein